MGRIRQGCGHRFFILEHHPHELRAYREGIAYCLLADDSSTEKKLLGMAERNLDADALEKVREIYHIGEERGIAVFSRDAACLFDCLYDSIPALLRKPRFH